MKEFYMCVIVWREEKQGEMESGEHMGVLGELSGNGGPAFPGWAWKLEKAITAASNQQPRVLGLVRSSLQRIILIV